MLTPNFLVLLEGNNVNLAVIAPVLKIVKNPDGGRVFQLLGWPCLSKQDKR